MLFEFNVYSGLLLLGVVQAVTYAVLLAHRAYRHVRWADRFAAFILLAGALFASQWMLGFAGWYDSHDWHTTLMFYFPWYQLPALGPLIWLYFRSLTNADFGWERRLWVHFLPWLVVIVVPSLIVAGLDVGGWILTGSEFTYFHGTRGPAQQWLNGIQVDDLIRTATGWLVLLAYLTLTVREYRQYRGYLQREFSNAAPLELSGLRTVLLLFVSGIAVVFLLQLLTTWLIPPTYVSEWPRFFAMSVLMYLAAIQFYAIDGKRLSVLRFEPAIADPPAPVADQEELAPVITAADRRMIDHHDYLEPDLRLAELAERIGSTSALLSKAINGERGMNFNDYVNGYRCRAFLEALQSGRHERQTLLSLALEAGFNSKSTFNRAFRKQLGISPKEAVARVESGFDPSQIMIWSDR
jgi:AraC-like DNA-binding protein